MELWQDVSAALVLLAAVLYLAWRFRRIGKRGAPPCASCEHCAHAKREESMCSESMLGMVSGRGKPARRR